MRLYKKDFAAFAAALRQTNPGPDLGAGERGQWRLDVQNVADVLATANGMFDRERFYAACGWGGHQPWQR